MSFSPDSIFTNKQSYRLDEKTLRVNEKLLTEIIEPINLDNNIKVGNVPIGKGLVDGVDVSELYSQFLALPSNLKDLTISEVSQLSAIDGANFSPDVWNFLSTVNQTMSTSDDVRFKNMSLQDLMEKCLIQIRGASNKEASIRLVSNSIGTGFEITMIGEKNTNSNKGSANTAYLRNEAGQNIKFGNNLEVEGSVSSNNINRLQSNFNTLYNKVEEYADNLNVLDELEVKQLSNIDDTVITKENWQKVAVLDQYLNKDSKPEFDGATLRLAPVENLDAVNKQYVDSMIQGLEWQDSVKKFITQPNDVLEGGRYIVSNLDNFLNPTYKSGATLFSNGSITTPDQFVLEEGDILEFESDSATESYVISKVTRPSIGASLPVDENNEIYVFSDSEGLKTWKSLGGIVDHNALQNVGKYNHYELDDHVDNKSNPHNVTIEQISPATEKGDIMIHNGTSMSKVKANNDSQLLVSSNASSTGYSFVDIHSLMQQFFAYSTLNTSIKTVWTHLTFNNYQDCEEDDFILKDGKARFISEGAYHITVDINVHVEGSADEDFLHAITVFRLTEKESSSVNKELPGSYATIYTRGSNVGAGSTSISYVYKTTGKLIQDGSEKYQEIGVEGKVSQGSSSVKLYPHGFRIRIVKLPSCLDGQ